VCKALDLEFNQIIALKVQHPLCSTPPHPTPPLTLGILEAEMLAQLHAWLWDGRFLAGLGFVHIK
jgi:hypothetical protein